MAKFMPRSKEAAAAIAELAKADPVGSGLMSIPGVGPVTASALVASVGDAAKRGGLNRGSQRTNIRARE